MFPQAFVQGAHDRYCQRAFLKNKIETRIQIYSGGSGPPMTRSQPHPPPPIFLKDETGVFLSVNVQEFVIGCSQNLTAASPISLALLWF